MDVNMHVNKVTEEAHRILMGKMECQTVYMRVYILSEGKVFPEMKAKWNQLWSECVVEAANKLGYL